MTGRELILRLQELSPAELERPVVIDGAAGDIGADSSGYVEVGNLGLLPSRRILLD
jgi:hypothetical protein